MGIRLCSLIVGYVEREEYVSPWSSAGSYSGGRMVSLERFVANIFNVINVN